MILDSEQQKGSLIQLIKSAGVGGNLEQAKQTIMVLEKLLQSVKDAEISSEKLKKETQSERIGKGNPMGVR